MKTYEWMSHINTIYSIKGNVTPCVHAWNALKLTDNIIFFIHFKFYYHCYSLLLIVTIERKKYSSFKKNLCWWPPLFYKFNVSSNLVNDSLRTAWKCITPEVTSNLCRHLQSLPHIMLTDTNPLAIINQSIMQLHPSHPSHILPPLSMTGKADSQTFPILHCREHVCPSSHFFFTGP